MANEATLARTGARHDVLERLQARLLPTLVALREQPWMLAAASTAEPPSGVFRAAAPGELWVPLEAAGQKAFLYVRWQPGEPSRELVVRAAADTARAVAGAITAEHRAERSASRAARAERRWAKDHDELASLRAELGRARATESELRAAIIDHETRASSFAPLGASAAFLSGIAHDVRSPLTAALCNVAALEADIPSPSPGVSAALGDIRTACERIESVIGAVRPLTESARDATRVDVPTCVAAIMRIVRLSASRAGVQIDSHIDASLSAVMPSADLCQILLHLLENAVEASPRGSIVRVEGRLCDGVPTVRISDSGPGMTAADRASAFTPFRSKKPGALGIGLAVARTLARKHGGDVILTPIEPGLGGLVAEVRLHGTKPMATAD